MNGYSARLVSGTRRRRKKRAVSELIAALIMVFITITGFGVYYGVLRYNLSLSSSTLTEQFQKGSRVAGQQVDLSYWTINPSTGQISLFVYNYGFSDFTFNRIVVTLNDTSKQTFLPSSFSVSDALNPTTPLPPGLVPVKTLTIIKFTPSPVNPRPLLVTLVGTDVRLFQWRIG